MTKKSILPSLLIVLSLSLIPFTSCSNSTTVTVADRACSGANLCTEKPDQPYSSLECPSDQGMTIKDVCPGDELLRCKVNSGDESYMLFYYGDSIPADSCNAFLDSSLLQ